MAFSIWRPLWTFISLLWLSPYSPALPPGCSSSALRQAAPPLRGCSQRSRLPGPWRFCVAGAVKEPVQGGRVSESAISRLRDHHMEDAQVGWIAAIIIGGLAGWLAEMFMKSNQGALMNIILGIVGAIVAN